VADHDDEGQLEARPVETGEPSDLMTALNAVADTGRGISTQLAGISTSVARAHRRRSGVILGAGIIGLVVLIQGAVFLRSQDGAQSERRSLIECAVPSTPGDRHECFEEREAAAVARTARAATAVAKCVADRAPDVQACVEAILAAVPTDPDLPAP